MTADVKKTPSDVDTGAGEGDSCRVIEYDDDNDGRIYESRPQGMKEMKEKWERERVDATAVYCMRGIQKQLELSNEKFENYTRSYEKRINIEANIMILQIFPPGSAEHQEII